MIFGSHVETCIDWTSFDKDFEPFTAQNNHLLYYSPTIYNSISKICPKFQVLSSYFSEVYEQHYENQDLARKNWFQVVKYDKSCKTLSMPYDCHTNPKP